MSSIKEQEQQEKKQGWNWEVNHDGVIWSWSHSSSCSFDYTSRPVEKQEKKEEKKEEKKQEKKEKKSLIDYWYVHDGIVIPTGDQY